MPHSKVDGEQFERRLQQILTDKTGGGTQERSMGGAGTWRRGTLDETSTTLLNSDANDERVREQRQEILKRLREIDDDDDAVGDEPTVAKQAKIELIKDGLKREASQLSGTGDADTSTESVGADESTTASAPETIGTEKEGSTGWTRTVDGGCKCDCGMTFAKPSKLYRHQNGIIPCDGVLNKYGKRLNDSEYDYKCKKCRVVLKGKKIFGNHIGTCCGWRRSGFQVSANTAPNKAAYFAKPSVPIKVVGNQSAAMDNTRSRMNTSFRSAATSNGIVQSQSAKPTDRLKFTQYAHMFLARLVTKADEEHGMKYDVSQVVLSDRIILLSPSETLNNSHSLYQIYRLLRKCARDRSEILVATPASSTRDLLAISERTLGNSPAVVISSRDSHSQPRRSLYAHADLMTKTIQVQPTNFLQTRKRAAMLQRHMGGTDANVHAQHCEWQIPPIAYDHFAIHSDHLVVNCIHRQDEMSIEERTLRPRQKTDETSMVEYSCFDFDPVWLSYVCRVCQMAFESITKSNIHCVEVHCVPNNLELPGDTTTPPPKEEQMLHAANILNFTLPSIYQYLTVAHSVKHWECVDEWSDYQLDAYETAQNIRRRLFGKAYSFKPSRRMHVVRREYERLHERLMFYAVYGGRYECRACHVSFTRPLLIDQHVEACHIITAPKGTNIFTLQLNKLKKNLKIRAGKQWLTFVEAVKKKSVTEEMKAVFQLQHLKQNTIRHLDAVLRDMIIPPHDIENNDFLYSTSETNFTYTIKSEEEERRAKMTRKTDANTSANGLMDESINSSSSLANTSATQHAVDVDDDDIYLPQSTILYEQVSDSDDENVLNGARQGEGGSYAAVNKYNRKCPVCGESYQTNRGLHLHLNRFHRPTFVNVDDCVDGRKHACRVCGKRMKDRRSLATHEWVRHQIGDGPLQTYPCDQCGKVCATTTSLKTHQRQHSGAKPYKCPHCDAEFKQIISLTLHVDTHHTRMFGYLCKQCNFYCSFPNQLRKHLQSSHSVHNENLLTDLIDEQTRMGKRHVPKLGNMAGGSAPLAGVSTRKTAITSSTRAPIVAASSSAYIEPDRQSLSSVDTQPLNYSYTESPFKPMQRGRLPQFSTNQLIQQQLVQHQPQLQQHLMQQQQLQHQPPTMVDMGQWTAAEWLLHHNW